MTNQERLVEKIKCMSTKEFIEIIDEDFLINLVCKDCQAKNGGCKLSEIDKCTVSIDEWLNAQD